MTIFASKETWSIEWIMYCMHIRGKLKNVRGSSKTPPLLRLIFSFLSVSLRGTSVDAVLCVPALGCTEHVPPETKRLFVPCRSRWAWVHAAAADLVATRLRYPTPNTNASAGAALMRNAAPTAWRLIAQHSAGSTNIQSCVHENRIHNIYTPPTSHYGPAHTKKIRANVGVT